MMNIADEMQKLADMRQKGLLTEEEFSQAKQRLLSQAPASAAGEEPAGTTEAPSALKTYRSSRWSAHNLFFPDSVVLASDGIIFRKGRMFGSSEEHINYRSIASIRATNGLFLSSISIETSGGSQPIFVNGLWKSDARKIQDSVRLLENRA
jgi:hypothetical protein